MPDFVAKGMLNRYPAGTVVSAYAESVFGMSFDGGAPPAGAAVVDSAAVAADGTLTIDGLSENTAYRLYALVGGEHRWVRVFHNPAVGSSPSFGAFTDGQFAEWDTTTGQFVGGTPGVVSPVTTDPLTFSGAVLFSKDVRLDTTGGTRTLKFANATDDAVAGQQGILGLRSAGGSVRDGLSSGYDGGGNAFKFVISASRGIELRGATGTPIVTGVAGSMSDPGVQITNTTPANPAVVFKGAAAQTGNLLEVQDSATNKLFSIESNGLLRLQDTYFYRSAAGVLRTSGTYLADSGFKLQPGAFFDWGYAANEQTTVGVAGAAALLPAAPTKYLKVRDSAGTELVIPAYAAA